MKSWDERPEHDDELSARTDWEKRHGLIISSRGWLVVGILGVIVMVAVMMAAGALEV